MQISVSVVALTAPGPEVERLCLEVSIDWPQIVPNKQQNRREKAQVFIGLDYWFILKYLNA